MILSIQQGLKDDGFEVPVAKLCRWFGVARRTVYYRPTKAPPQVRPELAEPIKNFENWVGMLMGQRPESCGLAGVCSPQHVVEANGDIYPCDFYCLDDYRLGNIHDEGMTIQTLDASERACAFLKDSVPLPEACQSCEVLPLCRGGCKRDRFGFDYVEGPPAVEQIGTVPEGSDEMIGLNRYCRGYKRFFRYALPRMEQLAQSLRR